MATSKISLCCPPVLHARLKESDAGELAATFRALGDAGRLRLLSFIAAQPDGEACVCNLTGAIELSQPTVSHHLKILTEAGLLEREKRGTWVFYRVVPARLAVVRAALAPPVARPRKQRLARADAG